MESGDPQMGEPIIFEAAEKKRVVMSRKAAEMMEVLRDSVNNYEEDEAITLENIDEEILIKIKDFCEMNARERMAEIPKPIKYGKSVGDYVQKQYKEYVEEILGNNDYKTLFKLILAADFLHIEDLLNLCSATIGPRIMNKTPDEIEEMLGIGKLPDDLRKVLREETRWSMVSDEDIFPRRYE